MRRQAKYPDTSTFHFYNANPKNRAGGDCVVRAIATALNQSWEQTIRELTEVGLKHGYVLNDKHTYKRYLESKGYATQQQPRKADNTKYTGKEWCQRLQRFSKAAAIVAHIGGGHIVCIKPANGRYKVHDIWDSTDGCIGNYWVIS